jgi:flagellar export protein FliJ
MKAKRLARLVRLRKLVEQSHAADLQGRKSSLQAAEDELTQTLVRIQEVQDKPGNSSAVEMLWRSSFEEHLEDEADEHRELIGQRQQVVAESEEIVRAAWQRRRLIEHLQDRAEAREFEEEKSKSYREMDEMSLMRGVRKTGEGE